MMLAAALALAQVVVSSGEGLSIEQRTALLAREYGTAPGFIDHFVYDDSALRAEMRRVGFAKGCEAVYLARRDVSGRHVNELRAAYASAIGRVIPAQSLAQARPVSFIAGPLSIYGMRVQAQVQRADAPLIAVIAADMRRAFLDRTRSMPTTTDPDDNRIEPKGDLAAALRLGEFYDLESPTQIAVACSDQRTPPHLRPEITTGSPQPQLYVPAPSGPGRQGGNH